MYRAQAKKYDSQKVLQTGLLSDGGFMEVRFYFIELYYEIKIILLNDTKLVRLYMLKQTSELITRSTQAGYISASFKGLTNFKSTTDYSLAYYFFG